MSWTFGGVAFEWSQPGGRGLPTRPTWSREPRLVERELLGTEDVDIARVGFKAPKMGGRILVAAANVAALQALNGTRAALSDGVTSWMAVASFALDNRLVTAEGAVGTATFTKARI